MTKRKIFFMDTQLKVGDEGQRLLCELYPRQLYPLDGFKGDLMDELGYIYELKTDTYPLSTGNFFMERYSNYEARKDGGIWQAINNDVDILLYFFIKDRVVFEFDNLPKLAEYLEREVFPKLEPVYVRNKTYAGQGFKVPRTLIAHFAKCIELGRRTT